MNPRHSASNRPPRDDRLRDDRRRDESRRDAARGRGPHYRGFDERGGHAASRRDDDRGAAPRHYGGGEYLRDAPAHRAGWPDVNYEYEHSGDYADEIVGGDYVRGYGSDLPPDLYDRRDDEALARIGPRRHPRGAAGDYDRLLSGFGEARYGATHGDQRGSVRGERAAPAAGFRGKGPRNYVRSDERIREDLCERLTDDDAVDASGISVDVQNGIVTLNGSVEQRWIKHRAEDIAEACSGVKDVVNHLRVEPAQNSLPPQDTLV